MALLSLGLLAAESLADLPALRAAQAQGIVRLGEFNRVTFSRPSVVDVEIPRHAVMAFPLFKRNRDLEITGAGRLAAFLLAPLTPGFEGRTVLAGLFRTCGEPGCSGPVQYFTHPKGLKRFDRIDLPAGRYRMYLINDEAPVSLELHLHGLEGLVRLEPSARADLSIGQPVVRVSTGPANMVYSAGQTDNFESHWMSWTALWLSGTPSGYSDLGTCLYRGVPPVPQERAYLHDCYQHGATGYHDAWLTPGFSFREIFLVFLGPMPAGRWSHGEFYERTSPIGQAGGLELLLRY